VLRYATADLMRGSCVACHNSHPDSPKRDWSTGDVRGVLEVVQPMDLAQAGSVTDLAAAGAVAVLAALGVTLLFFRLRLESDGIAESNRLLLHQRIRTIQVQDEERRRMALELHDGTGQTLTTLLVGLRSLQSAKLPSETTERVGLLRELTSTLMDDIGRMARGLLPEILDNLGLVATLERRAKESARALNMEAIDVQVTGGEYADDLSTTMRLTLYRIFQEALSNVAKHSNAHLVSVVLNVGPDIVQLIVEDSGDGFDVNGAANVQSTGVGLLSMRERAESLGGSLTLESTSGAGTTVYVQLPRERETSVA
jgi:signal transduction histidine kinase